jgi:hypothetical protein
MEQAGDIHGGITFRAHSRETALPQGYTAAAYAALFLVTSAYTHTITAADLTVWEWAKLTTSTLILGPVFITTEYRSQGVEFAPPRCLSAIVVIAPAVNRGAEQALFSGPVGLLSNWLARHF